MSYTVEEKMDIGRRVHERELTRQAAATEYKISPYTVRDYVAMYRTANHLSPARNTKGVLRQVPTDWTPARREDYERMTKEELILELVKARISEARAKKGYEVRGAGTDKEFIRFDNKNTK